METLNLLKLTNTKQKVFFQAPGPLKGYSETKEVKKTEILLAISGNILSKIKID